MCEVSMTDGHEVTSPSLVSVGCDGKWLVYGCSADMLMVCLLKSDGTEDTGSAHQADFVGEVRLLTLTSGEKLSVIHMHPTKEHLCVGTTHNGLYLTSASNPTLNGPSTRLSVCLSGGCVLAACFIDGFVEGSDILVLSCKLREDATYQFRLSLWDVQARALLWRGCADALHSLVALPGPFGFAASTRQQVTLWSVEGPNSKGKRAVAGSTITRGDGKSNGTLTVMSRACSSVKELERVEYVSLLSPAGAETSLIALTSAGFLISFDLGSGEPLKWMDCKVCPATAVYRSTAHIIICGALVRFFSGNWEFCGKIRPSEHLNGVNPLFLSRLTHSNCTGAAVCGGNDKFAFFFSGGHMSRYHVTISAATSTAASKLSFSRLYLYTPVFPEEKPLRWIPISAEIMCLWSPCQLRFYGARLRFSKSMTIDSTCATYHDGLGVLLVYESSVYEIVAIVPSSEKVVCRLGVTEPLTCLLMQDESRFVGLSPGNNLFYYEGCWKDAQHFSLFARNTTRLANLSAPLTHLVSSAGVLCAASMRLVANLKTGNTILLRDDIISFAAAGELLLVVHRHCCVVMDASLLQPVGEALKLPVALQEAVPAPGGHLVALRSEGEVSVVNLTDRCVLARFGSPLTSDGRQTPAVMCVGFTMGDDNLVLCNSNGFLTLHALSDVKATPMKNSPRTLWCRARQELRQEHSSVRRSSSCGGGPTNLELQSRFKDLHGYYETTRSLQKKRDVAYLSGSDIAPGSAGCRMEAKVGSRATTSTSGVLILTEGKSILQIPSGPHHEHLPSLRKWESDMAPSELPQVLGKTDVADVGVSTSMVEVSALTSVESKPVNFRALGESEVEMSPSLAADLQAGGRATAMFSDVPAHGVQSPTRKGQPSITLVNTPEDDAVNIDSLEREDVRQHLHCDPVAVFCGMPTTNNATSTPPVSNSLLASMRMKSWEIRDKLKELAEAYDSRLADDGDEDNIDDETVEELFSTVSRIYARAQSRQLSRPSSVRSVASDMSSASINTVLVDLQRLQRQNNRIEAQNQEILTMLLKRDDR